MKEYFDQDALAIPAEQIAQKSQEMDYNFFLSQPNFLKVTDSLEKFEKDLVDTSTVDGKNFLTFKTKLYQMYEVKNRSVYEHQAYTMKMDRQTIDSLYGVTQNFVHESSMIDQLDQQIDTQALGGAIFKAKTMTPDRLKGLVSLTTSALAFHKMTALTLLTGTPIVPALAIAGTAVYGMQKFSNKGEISGISLVDNQTVELTVQKSPIVSYTITANIKDVQSMCTFDQNEYSDRADAESHIVEVRAYTQDGEEKKNGLFKLTSDSYRDSAMLDWILSSKGEEETLHDFNDLMLERFEARKAAGGLSGFASFEARQTGFAKIMEGEQAKYHEIKHGDEQQLLELKEFAEKHGIEKLEELEPEQLYEMYQQHAQAK